MISVLSNEGCWLLEAQDRVSAKPEKQKIGLIAKVNGNNSFQLAVQEQGMNHGFLACCLSLSKIMKSPDPGTGCSHMCETPLGLGFPNISRFAWSIANATSCSDLFTLLLWRTELLTKPNTSAAAAEDQ